MTATLHSPTNLLANLVDRKISITHVVSDRAFVSSEEAAAIIQTLSKSAVDLNLSKIISELGQAEAIGSHQTDPLDAIPEVKPVMRVKVPCACYLVA